MAIVTNDSSVKTVVSKKLYTGLHNLKVVAINPNKVELEKLGFKPKEEPVYFIKNAQGLTFTVIKFYLQKDDILVNVPFFISDREKVSQTGKNQYMTKEGISSFSDSAEAFKDTISKWSSKPNTDFIVKACEGQVDLHAFLFAWCNVANGKELFLDTYPSIVKGNWKELTDLLKAIPNNTVRCLLGVKDSDGKKYQDIYTKYFYKTCNDINDKEVENWKKQLEGQYSQYNNDYQGSLEPKEYKASLSVSDAADTENNPITDDNVF